MLYSIPKCSQLNILVLKLILYPWVPYLISMPGSWYTERRQVLVYGETKESMDPLKQMF